MHLPIGISFTQSLMAFLNIVLLVGFIWALINIIFIFPKKIAQLQLSVKNIEEMLGKIKNNKENNQ